VKRSGWMLAAVGVGSLLALTAPGQKKEPLRKPLPTAGRATIKGTVTLLGERPDLAALTDRLRSSMNGKPESREVAKTAEQQEWKIGPKGELANAVIWLQTPEGFYFQLSDDDLDHKKAGRPKEVILEIRQFQYQPRTAILFPSYYDPALESKRRPTGQSVRVKWGFEDVIHNPNWTGGPNNPGGGRIIPPKPEIVWEFQPDRRPICIGCDIHPWMSAHVWVFEHPFAAVTDRDGRFEVRNAPAGCQLRIQGWHEGIGWLAEKGREGDAIDLIEGKVHERNFSVRYGPG
jgi:hypothetical protein